MTAVHNRVQAIGFYGERGEAAMAKYGPKAQELVKQEIKAMEAGKLRSGSGEKVTNPKQAIAIALSEARKAGAKMPPPPPGTASAEKAGAKKSRKSAVKKAAGTKGNATEAPAKKSSKTKAPAKKVAAEKAPAKAAAKKASAKS